MWHPPCPKGHGVPSSSMKWMMQLLILYVFKNSFIIWPNWTTKISSIPKVSLWVSFSQIWTKSENQITWTTFYYLQKFWVAHCSWAVNNHVHMILHNLQNGYLNFVMLTRFFYCNLAISFYQIFPHHFISILGRYLNMFVVVTDAVTIWNVHFSPPKSLFI